MRDYYNRSNRKKRRSRREKIGFYTAFSICLIAVCMAVYSTYNTLSVNKSANPIVVPTTSSAAQVNENVQGVTETLAEPKLDELFTEASDESSATEETTGISEDSSKTALETMLSTDLSLQYPITPGNVIREYSEKSVYFKTPNVWKPHTGVDFSGEIGNDVKAMNDGAVTKVYDDRLYGKTVEISSNNAVCIYSGLGSVSVNKGDSVKTGDKIGVIGNVPFESDDASHIHVAIKIDGKFADPLSFIGNEE